MQRSDVTRKGTIIKKIPDKRLSIIGREESSSSMSGFSTDIMLQNDVATPNSPRKTVCLKSLDFNGTLTSKETPLSPSTPFGPKTKACIIPCKDLSETTKTLEMDVLEMYNIWSDIGKGSYAIVKLATHKLTMQKCAIKSQVY